MRGSTNTDGVLSVKKRGRVSAESERDQYWPVHLTRAAPALIVGLVITFSVDHSAEFGLAVFGAFAVATGIVIGWGAFRLEKRSASFAQAAASVLLGVAAFVLMTTGPGTLFLLVITFAAVTGFLELYQGLRARGTDPMSRDWITVGVMTGLLAIAVLLVPADYAAPWSVVDKGVTATGILTSQIVVVGIVGAYAILLGVYLVIAGLSARWSNNDDAVATAPVTEQ